MSKKILLVLLLTMIGTAVAEVATASAGPPPNCRLHPNDPRCRGN